MRNNIGARLARLERMAGGSAYMYVVTAPQDGYDPEEFLRSLGHEVSPQDLVVQIISFGWCEGPGLASIMPLRS
jgi:hypothetical protein